MAPPTVLDKVVNAITTLAEPAGASRQAILKCIKATYGSEVSAAHLKKALQSGVQKGILLQKGQRFGLVGIEMAPRAESTVDKTILKPAPEGRACEAGDTVDVACCRQ